MTYTIPFTQYMLPNGARRSATFECNEETYAQSKRLLEDGYYFDAEILSTGMVSLTCEEEDRLVNIEVVANGPDVVQAVERLVAESYATVFGETNDGSGERVVD